MVNFLHKFPLIYSLIQTAIHLEIKIKCPNIMQNFSFFKDEYQPNYVIHADNVLRHITRVVDNSCSCLHPNPLTVLPNETIVLAH